VNQLTPQQLADLWYLKYEHKWIPREHLEPEWKKIANTLMKNSLLEYELSGGWSQHYGNKKINVGVTEILKLKEQ
jgi:hypothetical protein